MRFLKRPSVNDDDGFLSKIIKYIPAEIIAVYTAIIGVLKDPINSKLPTEANVNTYFIILIIITLITPIWTYFAVLDNATVIAEPPSKKKRAFFHAFIATIAFLIWVYAIGDILFKSWLCKCFDPQTLDCFTTEGHSKYNSILGSVVLILFTGLAVPLLERLILGKPIPPITLPTGTLTPQQIINECENNFESNKSDCNAFAKAVSSAFGITLTGQADDIVDQIQTGGWTLLANGIAAKQKADTGWLVIAGLKGADNVPPQSNGHVAIIVSGPIEQQKYPSGYWGRLNGVGEKNKTINWAWNKTSRDSVIYSAIKV